VDGIEVTRLAGTHHLHMENAQAVAAQLLRFRAAGAQA
jgi:hypothetical protein